MKRKPLVFLFNAHPSEPGVLGHPHYVIGPTKSKFGPEDEAYLKRHRFVGIYVAPRFLRRLEAKFLAAGLLDEQKAVLA